jgi:hypothetical protein
VPHGSTKPLRLDPFDADDHDQDIEAEARALLREKIQRMPWHQGLRPQERERRIEDDVERYWPTMVEEAAQQLVSRFGSGQNT